MCGSSQTKIKDDNFKLYLGYYGGSLMINNDIIYSQNKNINTVTDVEMQGILENYKKEDLAKLLVNIVKNGHEF